MSWSSGKDSASALHAVSAERSIDVVGLLTTVNADAERVAMHAVRRNLLEAQADRLGLPLHVVELPSPCPNGVYETKMAEAMAVAASSHIDDVILATCSWRMSVPTARRRSPAPASRRSSPCGAARPAR